MDDGDNLGDSSNIDERGPTDETARETGVVGSFLKSDRARQADDPVILQRDVDPIDWGQAGLHFLALHCEIGDDVDTREAMNGTDVAERSAVGERNYNFNNTTCILRYSRTERRETCLAPAIVAGPPSNSPDSTSLALDNSWPSIPGSTPVRPRFDPGSSTRHSLVYIDHLRGEATITTTVRR